jgi:formylglycine-generating enzyme required for sulfatase activity
MKGKRVAVAAGAVALVVLGFAAYHGWPQIRFFYLFAPLGLNAQGFPEYRHRQTGIVFVKLPGRTFWMGAQITDPSGRNFYHDAIGGGEAAYEDEGPVHEVTLSPFSSRNTR